MKSHYLSAYVLLRLTYPLGIGLALMAPFFGTIPARAADGSTNAPLKWWKGNLHTHSHWSDGDDYPEMIADWYKRHGYHFLAFSEHNRIAEGKRWVKVAKTRGGPEAFEEYVDRFGEDWVETKQIDGELAVRLQPLNEFSPLFEESGRFLLVKGEEITDHYENKPVHLNASNLESVIPPQGGDSVYEVLQNNVDAVLKQRRQAQRPILPHINHPNFGWALQAEDIMRVEGEQFFEVYNGHPAVRNQGDRYHASTERMWDIILSIRLSRLGMPPLYGIATDDAHSYHTLSSNHSNPGRGWVMVQSRFLTPRHLIEALEAGRFYASTGVELNEIRHADRTFRINVAEEPGISYTIRFIGTRKGTPTKGKPIRDEEGQPLAVTRDYSDAIGKVFKEVSGPTGEYRLKGDELYVRAKVISSKNKANPYTEGENEVAWVQPWVPEE